MAATGLYVPLVMIPRFTTYVGQATYTSAPLDVNDYVAFTLTVWRGPLLGSGSTLSCVFEVSEDADVWSDSGISAITTANTSSSVSTTLTRRWLRVKVTLTGADSALTCWAIGNLERREQGGGNGR